MAQIVTEEKDLIPGRWYAIGFKPLDGEIEWGGCMLYRYEGEGEWSDENGPVDDTWDPVLQYRVHVSDADAFALQG